MFYQEEENQYMGLKYIMDNYKGSTTISIESTLKRVEAEDLFIYEQMI